MWEAGLELDRLGEQRAGEQSGDPSLLPVGLALGFPYHLIT